MSLLKSLKLYIYILKPASYFNYIHELLLEAKYIFSLLTKVVLKIQGALLKISETLKHISSKTVVFTFQYLTIPVIHIENFNFTELQVIVIKH